MGILWGVRNYPIYRGEFGHYNLLGFSPSVHPFITKIGNSLPLPFSDCRTDKKDHRSNHSLVEEIFIQTSQVHPKLPQLTVLFPAVESLFVGNIIQQLEDIQRAINSVITNLHSLERRPERCRVIYIWKIIE